MNRAHLLTPLMVAALAVAGVNGAWTYGPDPLPADSPEYVASQLRYSARYPWLDYRNNLFESPDSASLNRLFAALRRSQQAKVRVVHIGDSHVQADIFTGLVRNRLQQVFGQGGRGMVFPYAAAYTHSAYDYSTTRSGHWQYARNIQRIPDFDLGLSGVTAYTTDANASFRLAFNDYALGEDNRRLRIFCRCSDSSFALRVRINGRPDAQLLSCRNQRGPWLEALLPEKPRWMEVSLVREDSLQRHVELYGLMLDDPRDRGLLYHSVGINGADFPALLRQVHMDRQLAAIDPHLVVVDVSGNEYFAGGLQPDSFALRLGQVLHRIKRAAPGASVVVSCSQDIYRWRRQSHPACAPAAQLARRVAFANGCAFYDYHRASGGSGSMAKWYAHGLAKYDRIHLNYPGYALKAELFANALLGTYYRHLRGENLQLALADSLPLQFARVVKPLPTYQAASYTPRPVGDGSIHVVQSGEVLGSIARMYGVSVSQLQEWNGLSGTLIRVGQRLVVHGSKAPAPAASSASAAPKAPAAAPKAGSPAPKATAVQPAPAKTTSPPDPKRPVTYTVASGDNLWTIARRYNMHVDDILRLNGLDRNAKLMPGQRLKLR